jgi:tetratricopeptide (TPR) repeat protein
MKVNDIRYLITDSAFCTAADEVGLSASWLRQKVRDESISVEDFKRLLAAGGQDEKQWLRSPLEILDLLGPTSWRADNRPEVVRKLVSAARKLSLQVATLARPSEAVLDCESASRTDVRGLVDDPSGALGAVYDLDEYSRQDPERVVILARVLATEVAPRLRQGQVQIFSEATGVLGTALRNTGQLDRAGSSLRVAVITAQKAMLTKTSARLFGRLAMVFRDRLEFENALRCLDEEAGIYLARSDVRSLVRTMASRGMVLSDAGRYPEAEVALKGTLDALGEEDWRYKAAVHHRLSIGSLELGRFKEAEAHLKLAGSLLRDDKPLNRAPIELLHGQLALAAGKADEAVERFLQGRELLKPNPISQASATVELIMALGNAGRFDEVRVEAKRMVFCLSPFDTIPEVGIVLKKISEILSKGITLDALRNLSGASALLREARA